MHTSLKCTAHTHLNEKSFQKWQKLCQNINIINTTYTITYQKSTYCVTNPHTTVGNIQSQCCSKVITQASQLCRYKRFVHVIALIPGHTQLFNVTHYIEKLGETWEQGYLHDVYIFNNQQLVITLYILTWISESVSSRYTCGTVDRITPKACFHHTHVHTHTHTHTQTHTHTHTHTHTCTHTHACWGALDFYRIFFVANIRA